MRHWILNFARKLLPTQQLRPPLRRPGRRAECLGLEILEERSVPATLTDDVSSALYASLPDAVSTSSAGATVALGEASASTSGLNGPGLDRLIQALQELEPSSTVFALSSSIEAASPLALSAAQGTPRVSSDAVTTAGVSGEASTNSAPESAGVSAAPTPPPTTETVSGSTSAAAAVSIGTTQAETGHAEGSVLAASTTFDPIVVETYPPAAPGGALSGPSAIQVLQAAAPEGWATFSVKGAAPEIDPEVSLSVIPSGTTAASSLAPPTQIAEATASPIVAAETDVVAAAPLPEATSAGPRTSLTELSDGSLLQLFAANREQSAFTTLVRRHESSVLRVCTQVLGDRDRAQDASQATFQTLARRAESLDGQAPLGGWLSTVAYHLALRFRANDVRRRQLERAAVAQAATEDVLDPGTDLEREELRAVLGEELDRMPAKYRVPLIRHYFDGRTHAEVAWEIGLPLGSIARRIEDALRRLRDRLINRGFPF